MQLSRTAFVAFAALTASACTLLNPLDGFSEPVTAGDGGPDATNDGGGGTPTDGAPEGGGTDAGQDAATDGPAVPFCATKTNVALCEDFDGADTQLTPQTRPNATQTVDAKNAHSSPKSLVCGTLVMTSSSQTAQAYRTASFPTASSRLRETFWLFIESKDAAQGLLQISGMQGDDPNGTVSYTAAIVLGTQSDFLEQAKFGTGVPQAQFVDTPLANRVPLARWVEVVVDVFLDGVWKVKVRVDQQDVLEKDLDLWTTTIQLKPVVTIGAVFLLGPSNAWSVRFDDVTFATNGP